MSIAAVAASISSTAYAGPGDASNIRITARVPVVCQIDAPVVSLRDRGGSSEATVSEFCNSAGRYRINSSVTSHSPGETITVRYGDQKTVHTQQGTKPGLLRNGPSLQRVPVGVVSSDPQSVVVVRFSMTLI